MSDGHDSEENEEDESNLDPNGFQIESSSEGEDKRFKIVGDSEDEEVSMRFCESCYIGILETFTE